MGSYQRKKGQRGEREAIKKIKHLFPSCHRNLEYQTEVADEGKDIRGTGMFDIQVKIGMQVPKKIYDFIKQIKENPGQIPTVFCRRDKEKWLAVLSLDDFIEILDILKKETGDV